jgi:subtilisin family serine protease
LKSKNRPAGKTAFLCRDFWNVTGIMFGKQHCGRFLKFVVVVTAMSCWLTVSAHAQAAQPAYRDDRILIQPKAGVARNVLNNFHLARKSAVLRIFEGIGRLQILSVPKGETVPSLVAQYQESGLVEFAEPDYLVYAAATPNDPYYTDGTLWGLNNYGQNGGTPDADIDAPEGWDVLTAASNIVVAVIDSGIRYTHEDLTSNMWVNPDDGGHGWNALTATNDPNDDNGHGTSMAGVLGAVGNNGKGVVGVAWSVQMMACKCLNSSGSGSDSDLITCIDYARTNGAKIINASLAGPNFSLAVSNAIFSTREAGIIFVAAAGNSMPPNSGTDVDINPTYPACYNIDNIVPAVYTTRTDALGQYSNYGATNTSLAAPGDEIYSTTYNSDSSYSSSFLVNLGYGTGTSYAAAYVSGACALLLAQYPSDTYQEIIGRLLSSTDPLPSLAGKCRTGGRLNLRNALRTIIVTTLPAESGGPFQLRVDGGLNRTCTVEASTNLMNWSSIFTNTTSTNGTFDFTDDQSTNSAQRFYRATATP